MQNGTSSGLLSTIVEPRRKIANLSLRRVADRAGMSEATWRQLVRGGVTARGRWVSRAPRRSQLLIMALAVGEGVFDQIVAELDATADEVSAARSQVRILDGAEEEILASRHLLPQEKLRLLEVLRSCRSEDAPSAHRPNATD